MSRPRRIYVATSWKNVDQPAIVKILREAGHEAYDFRNPAPGQKGFAWRDCGGIAAEDGPGTGAKTIPSYLEAVESDRAIQGFSFDKAALEWCDTCILVLPCGRSAHLELGYAAGQGKDTYVLLHEDKFEPELMYLLNTGIATDLDQIIDWMGKREPGDVMRWHRENGGRPIGMAGHALRILNEVIELCIAAGAQSADIYHVVHSELTKAFVRGDFNGERGIVDGEWADCALLLDIFAGHYGIDSVTARRNKLDTLWERRWRADECGVLWRIPVSTPVDAEFAEVGQVAAHLRAALPPVDSDGGHPD